MRFIIIFLLLSTKSYCQDNFLTFSFGTAGFGYNTFFNIYDAGFQKQQGKPISYALTNFVKTSISKKITKSFYLNSSIEYDSYSAYHGFTDISKGQDRYSIIYFDWDNAGLNYAVQPEFRTIDKIKTNQMYSFFINAGFNIRFEVLNITNARGLDVTGYKDISYLTASNRPKLGILANSGFSYFYNNIGISFEMGYHGINKSGILDDIIYFKRHSFVKRIGVTYTFN